MLRSSSAQSSCSSVPTNSSYSTLEQDFAPMRVYLVQTAKGLSSSSGGYKANICLLRYLASRGHSVRQLCFFHRGEEEVYFKTMNESGKNDLYRRRSFLHLRSENGGTGTDVEVAHFVMNDGIEVTALESEAFDTAFGGKTNMYKAMAKETADYIETGVLSPRLRDFVSFLQQDIQVFSPTHIMSNDGLSMQAVSAMEMPSMVVTRIGVIHTAEQLPFGPFAGGVPGHASSPSELKLLKMLDGIWSVSTAIKQYALEYGQLQTTFFVHHPWTYLEEKEHKMPVCLHNWKKKYVGMINPCPVKGSQILLSLADSCPQHEFLVYESWGLDDDLAKQLGRLPNLTLRQPCIDMEEAWRDIKVLLVPSVWFEAWGIVLIEAHLRGIPVIASNAGALSEAMIGLDYMLPVNPIAGHRDEQGMYILPEQDVTLWKETLNKLMTDESEYERLSSEVRGKTEQWLKGLSDNALEDWMQGMTANHNRHAS